MAALLALLGCRVAAAQQVRLGGHVSTRLQVGLDGCLGGDDDCRYLDLRNTNVLGLELQASPGPKVAVRGAVDIINVLVPEVETLEDTAEPDRIQPVSLRVTDAFVDLYGVGLRRLDLRIGAQRIRWGVGDGFNPTDRINPYDLEDPTRFDRRLAILALLASYQAGKVRFEVAVMPLFTPAALPMREMDFLATAMPEDDFDLNAYSHGEETIELRSVDTATVLPPFSLAETAVAMRVLWQGSVGDLGVSWYHGHDSLPQGHGEVLLTGYATDESRVDVLVPMAYPRLDVLGLEARVGPFRALSGWVEAALVFPQATELIATEWQLEALLGLGTIDEIPDPLPTQVTQDGAPYLQAIAGVDLNLHCGLYLNLQYMRGFPTERQWGDQGNYVLAAIRYTFAGGNVVLGTEAALEVRDDGTVGGMVSPQLSVMFGDAVDLGLGFVWLAGQQGSHFDAYTDLSHLRLSASVVY